MGKTGWKVNYVFDNPRILDDVAKHLVEKSQCCCNRRTKQTWVLKRLTAHKILLSNNILIIENIAI
jgi:kynurenine formamidase